MTFLEAVQKAVEQFGDQAADRLDISKPTLDRWLREVNSPAPILQKVIIKWAEYGFIPRAAWPEEAPIVQGIEL